MLTRVQFADEIEPLVQFIEETAPSEIVDQTLVKLRAGVPIRTMLMASALARVCLARWLTPSGYSSTRLRMAQRFSQPVMVLQMAPA